jgi:hypothetical protein
VISWDDLVAELVAAGVGGWDQILHEMTLPRYYALRRQWEAVPPVNLMLAHWLGLARPRPRPGDLGELLARFAGTGGVIR